MKRTALKPRIRRKGEPKRFLCPECGESTSVHKMSRTTNAKGVYVCESCEKAQAEKA